MPPDYGPPPQLLGQLVERFADNLDAYRAGHYNETQVRREFIDPFFTLLGWDVDNRQGYAEQYKDVIHEDAIKVGGVTKAPDYCFRIGSLRKFFVEAKKPSVNVREDIAAAFQVRRYAWSAKLPLSILTDFEEFAVYDCRKKPEKNDAASTGRIMLFTYRDYEKRWQDIAAVFAREAILKGSFDKFAASTRDKRGTAEVDQAFLAEIEDWRDALARNLALRNPALSQRELNFAVQRTIDRVIFLRICEDRGIEPYGQLQGLLNGGRVYPRLCAIFDRADERYNSGLFHFHAEKDRAEAPDELSLRLSIDDRVLKEIFTRLYYPDSPYEFSVLPADILGQVYEQFLGKVIRLTPGHQAKVEEKPEVKKAGGVYYTPTYIVDYIVEHTVGKLLAGKTPKQAAALRILDPACGSGSFLIGAYQYLLDWHLRWYLDDGPEKHARGKSPALVQTAAGWRLTTGERKRVLLNNIYGVDIDAQAVEVTRLSLLLKVLEGETAETLTAQITMFRERALPDLGSNIKCGNSLIGPDFYQGRQLTMLDEEELYRVNAFDWYSETDGFGKIMKAGGFDAVIGNPPYIRIQRINHQESDYLFKKYQAPTSKIDLSMIFLEKALLLINTDGFVGFICTSQWMSTDYGRNVRKMLSECLVDEIINFGSLPVFIKADTYPAIVILSRDFKESFTYKTLNSTDELSFIGISKSISQYIKFKRVSDLPWNLSDFDLTDVLINNDLKWLQMRHYAKAYIGVLTGMDKVFVVDDNIISRFELEEKYIYPYAYRGAEIIRYGQVHPNAKVIYPYHEGNHSEPILFTECELRDKCPNIYSYLYKFKENLKTRMDSRKYYASGDQWYRHLRPGNFDYIHATKLIVKGIDTKTTVGLLCQETAFNGANCPGIIVNEKSDYDWRYLIGVLNSSMISYYLKTICPPKLGGYTRFNATNISNVPIRLIDNNSSEITIYNNIIHYVQRMIELVNKYDTANLDQEKSILKRQIETTDRHIDALVYELYGLTEEEITIIEGKV